MHKEQYEKFEYKILELKDLLCTFYSKGQLHLRFCQYLPKMGLCKQIINVP
jgi:hypothetical protein